MELAIFAVLVLGISAGVWGYWNLRGKIENVGELLMACNPPLRSIYENSIAIMNVLTEASKRNAVKQNPPEAVFDKPNDKIPASGNRYIPVARRRAAAEAQSAGPANHDEQLRRNNAKVMETL